MKEYGKKFELDFFKSITSPTTFAYRIKTRKSQYKGDSEIADFFVYRYPSLFVFELKSTKEKRLDFTMIRANQVIGLDEVSKVNGVHAGVILQLREPTYSHWFIPIEVIREYIENEAKSIPLKALNEDPRIVEITFTKKRVSVTLDVDKLLNDIEGGIQ